MAAFFKNDGQRTREEGTLTCQRILEELGPLMVAGAGAVVPYAGLVATALAAGIKMLRAVDHAPAPSAVTDTVKPSAALRR